ncbi:MAG: hypothetical protein JSS96_10500, partial [Bacteroidetes bacterium]|nr:hypothetical protein [Bacteroidota bacterium]
HLMLAGMIANLIAMVLDKHSLYDHLKDRYLDESYKEDAEMNAGVISPTDNPPDGVNEVLF